MDQRYPFQPAALGFGLSSLSPYCDPDTLYLHHDQYYARKVRELNHLVSQHHLTDLTIGELLTRDLNLPPGPPGPAAERRRRRLQPRAVLRRDPVHHGRALTAVLIGVYGSMSAFRLLLLEAAESLPGVGWVWLAAERSGGPHIIITDNNETVDLQAVQPIFVADLWEHAYFLDGQFDKEKYMDYWFSFIDWTKAESRFARSRAST